MILVTGATGTVGGEVARQLLATGQPVRALVRDARGAAEVAGLGAEVALADLAHAHTLEVPFRGVERAFLASSLDPRQVELHANFIAAARRAGVSHVVRLSALGARLEAPARSLRWHAESARDLEHSGMAYTHLEPAVFMQNILRSAHSITREGAFQLPFGNARLALIDARDIGAVAVKALTEPGHVNRSYVLTGPESLTYHQVAQTLTNVLGREIRYVDVTWDAFARTMAEEGQPAWRLHAIEELYGFFRAGGCAAVTTTAAAVMRKASTAFDRFARDHRGAFSSKGPL